MLCRHDMQERKRWEILPWFYAEVADEVEKNKTNVEWRNFLKQIIRL